MRGGASVLGAPLEEIADAFHLNVLAATACMREAVADMRGKPNAAIINISSMTGHRLLPGTPGAYAATKHALRIMTDGLRSELAAEKLPIKVALISPGLVDTPWHRQPDGILGKGGSFPYEPLQPADVVEAVRYILSAPAHVQVGDIQLRSTGQPF
jgi:NADP-dependent 3-hydroxy acid dehydrogenase YdfG